MSILLSCLIAFVITILAINVLKPLAVRLELLDTPDGRKKHKGKVPLVGGIAIFFGFSVAVLTQNISLFPYRSFLVAAVILVFTGALDDFNELSARSKLIIQIICAVLITTWGGMYINELGMLISSKHIMLGSWAVPLSIFAIVALINSINMADGIDGLAGGLCFISIIIMGFLAWYKQSTNDTRLLALLASSLFAFLIYNFPIYGRKKASIFMGDAGSMFLGLVLSWFAVSLTQNENISSVLILYLLAIPIIDTSVTIVRRILRQHSPFLPGRDHFHHMLLEYGFSDAVTTYIILGFSIVIALMGIFLALYYRLSERWLFLVFLGVSLCYAIFNYFIWLKLKSRRENVNKGLS